jgi:uncharacterized protein
MGRTYMRRGAGGLMAVGLLALGLSPAVARGGDAAGGPLKVVVHVNFAEAGAQRAGLKSVENVLKAEPDARVEVVCHAAGIGLVERARSEHAPAVAELIRKGVRVVACENTMRQKAIRKQDLLPGVETVPSGAVEVIRKQQAEGYAYFKP